ncbi:MAG: metallophosphoesterase family protein [Vicinamibacteria bacterium]|nr:metallophosphoesterase family protein [Vicinamibacteria bacterium]
MTTLAHISDLHFGTESPEIVEGLIEDITRHAPALIVVSGDLTQRARGREFMAARAFLDRLPFPRLVVPGNHDIPLFDVLTRFARPLARFRRYINDEVDPFVLTDKVAALGINTARSNTWKDGRVSGSQIEKLRERMKAVPPGVMKVLVTHHPFLPPPGDVSPPLVGRAAEALQAAEACGVDLMLAGHLHVGYSGDVRTHHLGVRRSILVAQAGTATSHRIRGEANSYNVIRLATDRIDCSFRVWDGKRFLEAKSLGYLKRDADWQPIKAA